MRVKMDSWQFWMGIAYFGLAAIVVALWINFDRVAADQARTVRISVQRHDDLVASRDAIYRQCIASVPTLTRVNRFVAGVETVHAVILENALATHHSTVPGSAAYRTQASNIARLRVAFRDVNGVHFPVPTRSDCLARRNHGGAP